MEKFKTGDKVTFKHKKIKNKIIKGIIYNQETRTFLCTNEPQLNGGWGTLIKGYTFSWCIRRYSTNILPPDITELKPQKEEQTYKITNTGKEFNIHD